MTLYTGSITGGGAASLQTKLEELLVLNGNWEFVEEIWTSKYIRIWRNKGHIWNNNRPFYLTMSINNTTDLILRAGEEWDAVADQITGQNLTVSSGNVTLDASGRIGAATPAVTTTKAVSIIGVVDPTVVNYYFVVTSAFIYLSTSASANGGYIGLYEPSGVHSLTVEFPLVVIAYSASSPVVGFTRAPFLTSTQAYGVLEGSLSSDAYGVIPTGTPALNNKAILSRRKITAASIVRGFLPVEILTSAAPAAGVLTGDTITINGDSYFYLPNQSNHNWVKVA